MIVEAWLVERADGHSMTDDDGDSVDSLLFFDACQAKDRVAEGDEGEYELVSLIRSTVLDDEVLQTLQEAMATRRQWYIRRNYAVPPAIEQAIDALALLKGAQREQ